MNSTRPEPTSREGRQALRALRDCTRIRLTFDSGAYLELFEHGYADCAPVEGNDNALDYTITDNGRWAARQFAQCGAL